jgi:pimeloyl-ACP methyl ester carboxylesterase
MSIMPKNPAARLGLRLLGLLIIGYTLWCVAVYSIQDRLIFPRDMISPPSPEQQQLGPGESLIEFTSPDGQPIRAILWLPISGSRTSPTKPAERLPVAFLIHGNGEQIEHFKSAPQIEPYKNRRFAIVIPEFRGYGPVPGTPSQDGITRDLVALHDHLNADPRLDLSRTVYHGRSLGAGFASELAALRPPRGVVLESTFTSIASFTARYWVPQFICSHPLRNDRFIESFAGPSLIIHGTNDEVIPVSHARELAGLAKDATYFEDPSGAHLNIPTNFEQYDATIGAFLDRSGVTPKK